MWAGAQRGGRRTEYRWRCLRKFRNSISCTMPQTLADDHCLSAVQQHWQYIRTQELDAKWTLQVAKFC